MTEIYAVNCSPLMDEEQLNIALPQLDDVRLQKVLRLRNAQKRAQSAAAGLLINHLFDSETIDCDANGRPTILSNPQAHISISHTDNWIFCAVSCAPIGMDAQALTPRKPHIVSHLFSTAEQDTQSDEDFTRIWTHKEAYYKLYGNVPISVMRGTNYSRPLSSYDAVTGCYYHSSTFKDHIFLTVCAESDDVLPVNIHEISLSDLI